MASSPTKIKSVTECRLDIGAHGSGAKHLPVFAPPHICPLLKGAAAQPVTI